MGAEASARRLPEAAVSRMTKPRRAIRAALHFGGPEGSPILDFGFLIVPVLSKLVPGETTFPSIPNSERFVIHRRGDLYYLTTKTPRTLRTSRFRGVLVHGD